MKIILNGQEREISESSTLKNTIEQFCRDRKHVIAELNGQIVKSQTWDTQTLKNGDALELVNFVGGG